ncbi:MAG: type IV secretion system protein [Gammaproteobacteria bacterium]|nr:type IV secretion system protein [Gammaproteobacteria bacterium]
MKLQGLTAGALFSLLPFQALAAPIDPAGFLGEFFNKASRLTDDLISVSTQLYRFSELEWTTFTVFALVIVLIKWTIGAAAVKDVIFVVLMILIAQSLLQSYDYVLALLWEITTVLSDDINLNTYRALNLEASGIESTGVFLLDMINHIMERITFEPAAGKSGFFSMFTNFAISVRDAIFLGIFFIVLFIVFAVSWIISVVGLWSLLLGKVLGPIFIPFLIFKRASPYFDSWLNFMLGSVAYFIVAQINIAFTTLIIVELFDSIIVAGEIMTLTPDDFLQLLSYAGLLVVAVYAMFRTDRVVSDLIQGGVSASGAISQAASMLSTRLVR